MDIKKLKNKKILIPAVVIVILIAIYLVLCGIAGGKDFLSNATINGIEVGKMSKEEAVTALTQKYEEDQKDLVLNLKVNDQDYQIDMRDNVTFDTSSIDEISKESSGFFLSRGFNYFFHQDYTMPVLVKDENVLVDKIKKSKILNYNTKIDTTYTTEENKIVFKKGVSGQKTNQESILSTIHESLDNYTFTEDIVCPLDSSPIDDNEMETIHTELSKGALNATLDKDNDYAIVPERLGAEYDLSEAQSAYKSANEGDSFSVNAKIVQPTVTKELLEKNLFKDVLGEYSTYVSGTSVRRNNVKLASQKCSGYILLPGEEFSFNGVVGQRTKANGFGEAGAYLNGETVQEVGGGVCQSSSTLYNAVLLSNLEITQRSNHSFVSSYVPVGRDATVSWGGPDFKFKNNTDYPIKIVNSYSGGRLYSKIYGTNLEKISVKITSERFASKGFNVKYVDDPTLDEGKEKVEQSGYSGCKAQSYRYVYKDGKLISKTKEAYSVYASRDKIVRRGTKKKEEEKTPDTPQTTPTSPTTPTTPTPTPATPTPETTTQ